MQKSPKNCTTVMRAHYYESEDSGAGCMPIFSVIRLIFSPGTNQVVCQFSFTISGGQVEVAVHRQGLANIHNSGTGVY